MNAQDLHEVEDQFYTNAMETVTDLVTELRCAIPEYGEDEETNKKIQALVNGFWQSSAAAMASVDTAIAHIKRMRSISASPIKETKTATRTKKGASV